MRVSAAQLRPTGEPEPNLAAIGRLVALAAERGSELVILPEEAMLAADELVGRTLPEAAAQDWPVFVARLQELAMTHATAIIAGGYEAAGELPYNSIVAVDADGDVRAVYRKMHLYDAFDYQESQHVARGDTGPCVVDLAGFTVGLVNCYDLRFPEFTRSLVEMGAELLSVSAAWVRGPLKEDHWTTLLRARALENTCWVVSSAVSSPTCIGLSMAVDPLGVVRAALGEEPWGLLTIDVTKERLDEARTVLPVLRNRRIIIGQR